MGQIFKLTVQSTTNYSVALYDNNNNNNNNFFKFFFIYFIFIFYFIFLPQVLRSLEIHKLEPNKPNNNNNNNNLLFI